MLKATLFGTLLSSVIYISFGIVGFIIYRYDINDTLLSYLGDDLIRYLKTNKLIATLLIVFEFAFIANTTISTMLNFFIGKSGLINFVKFILKYKNKKNTKQELKDIPLTELDEKGVALKNNENVEKESLLSEGQKTLITLFAYIIVIFVGYASESIITVDNFNGSTVNNYLSVMLPALFFIILTRNKGFSFERLLAFFLFLFSLSLITSFLLINFTNILG
jgi:amino acid permease